MFGPRVSSIAFVSSGESWVPPAGRQAVELGPVDGEPVLPFEAAVALAGNGRFAEIASS